MKNNMQNWHGLRARISIVVLMLIVGLGITPILYASDSLYVGDGSDNTVKRFDADTGMFLGEFIKKGHSTIKGPRGLILGVIAPFPSPMPPVAPAECL